MFALVGGVLAVLSTLGLLRPLCEGVIDSLTSIKNALSSHNTHV